MIVIDRTRIIGKRGFGVNLLITLTVEPVSSKISELPVDAQ